MAEKPSLRELILRTRFGKSGWSGYVPPEPTLMEKTVLDKKVDFLKSYEEQEKALLLKANADINASENAEPLAMLDNDGENNVRINKPHARRKKLLRARKAIYNTEKAKVKAGQWKMQLKAGNSAEQGSTVQLKQPNTSGENNVKVVTVEMCVKKVLKIMTENPYVAKNVDLVKDLLITISEDDFFKVKVDEEKLGENKVDELSAEKTDDPVNNDTETTADAKAIFLDANNNVDAAENSAASDIVAAANDIMKDVAAIDVDSNGGAKPKQRTVFTQLSTASNSPNFGIEKNVSKELTQKSTDILSNNSRVNVKPLDWEICEYIEKGYNMLRCDSMKQAVEHEILQLANTLKAFDLSSKKRDKNYRKK